MRHVNEIKIRGRLVADAENTSGENKRTNFRVVTNVAFRHNGEWREKTTFHPVTVWGKNLQLPKGMTVDVRGEVEIRPGTRQSDGVKMDYYGIKAYDVVVVSDPAA